MHSSGFFRIKPIARLILKREISGSHTISDQSLLLSTNVLNDNVLNDNIQVVRGMVMFANETIRLMKLSH